MKRAIVIWNRKAGVDDTQEQHLLDAFRQASIDASIRHAPGPRLLDEARRALAAQPDIIVAAGGDGTISSVASVLVGQSTPLGVLPLGTLNHFAKDVGIPGEMQDAVNLIATGEADPIDVAEVNGRVFLNNSSLGLYPLAVRDREEQRAKLGRGKWWAMFLAALSAFRRFPLMQLRLDTREGSEHLKTPLIFVGNNEYEMDLFSVKSRSCLDRGHLGLYTVRSASRFGILRLSFLSLFRALKQERDFSAQCLKEFWVETRRRYVDVAVDGEVVRMTPPLHYRIIPKSLFVLRRRSSAKITEDQVNELQMQ